MHRHADRSMREWSSSLTSPVGGKGGRLGMWLAERGSAAARQPEDLSKVALKAEGTCGSYKLELLFGMAVVGVVRLFT